MFLDKGGKDRGIGRGLFDAGQVARIGNDVKGRAGDQVDASCSIV